MKFYNDYDLRNIIVGTAKKVQNTNIFYILKDNGPEFLVQTNTKKPGDTIKKLPESLRSLTESIKPIKFNLFSYPLKLLHDVTENDNYSWVRKEWFECYDDEQDKGEDINIAVIVSYSIPKEELKNGNVHSNFYIEVPTLSLDAIPRNSNYTFYPRY